MAKLMTSTMVFVGKTDMNHGKTDINHGKTDMNHGKTDMNHGKTDMKLCGKTASISFANMPNIIRYLYGITHLITETTP